MSIRVRYRFSHASIIFVASRNLMHLWCHQQSIVTSSAKRKQSEGDTEPMWEDCLLSSFYDLWAQSLCHVKLRLIYTRRSSTMIIDATAWGRGVKYQRTNIKMSSYQYRKSDCGDKTVVRSSYLHNGISYIGKMTSLYWIRAQFTIGAMSPWYNNCCRKFPWWYQRPSSGLFIRFGVISRAGAIKWVQEPFLAVCHIMTSRGIAPSRALLISSQPIFSVKRAATSCLV